MLDLPTIEKVGSYEQGDRILPGFFEFTVTRRNEKNDIAS